MKSKGQAQVEVSHSAQHRTRAQPLFAVSLGHGTLESGQRTQRKDLTSHLPIWSHPPQPSLLNYLLFSYKGNGLGENRELICKTSKSNHFPSSLLQASHTLGCLESLTQALLRHLTQWAWGKQSMCL